MYRPLLGGRRGQFGDEIAAALDQRGLDEHLVEPGRVGPLEAGFVRVIRIAEDRHVRPGVDDLVRVDARDVRDHEVRRIDAVGRDQVMLGKKPLELPTEEEVDARQQDRRHEPTLPLAPATANTGAMGLDEGLRLIRAGSYFAAHEELEDEWRASPVGERDFLQGLVHVAVAWYQAERGNRVGCERQLEKAQRRLAPYAPTHRGVDVEQVLASVDQAAGIVGAGSLELPQPRTYRLADPN